VRCTAPLQLDTRASTQNPQFDQQNSVQYGDGGQDCCCSAFRSPRRCALTRNETASILSDLFDGFNILRRGAALCLLSHECREVVTARSHPDTMKIKQVELFYDIVSPYSLLAFEVSPFVCGEGWPC